MDKTEIITVVPFGRRLGFGQELHDLVVRGINRFTVFKILRAVAIACAKPEFTKCPAPYRPSFLSAKQLRELALDHKNGMSERFVEEALSKGDECYGIFDGDRLASYGWYSFRPTRIDPPELVLRFDPQYVYMYKGFTHVRYRGQRLHAIGMTLALKHYLDRGYKGLVSYVESNNFDSLKSVSRMGYEKFGSIYLMRAFGRYLIHVSPGCERFGFAIEEREGELAEL
ncbi:hypothetical protein [Methylocaldum szegediense]|uniref:N-acetyltransferase domain-containing protein n=1 Tax=Methylocaldum szegediense TaxID=73780 RepID=A0ABN8XBF2_9GAMM|nr:hypothetical protein [Methylocaldum szegediense]CAI8955832.1 N-acetyltransferase domain-containing protein [Methylocaldum szegediense]